MLPIFPQGGLRLQRVKHGVKYIYRSNIPAQHPNEREDNIFGREAQDDAVKCLKRRCLVPRA